MTVTGNQIHHEIHGARLSRQFINLSHNVQFGIHENTSWENKLSFQRRFLPKPPGFLPKSHNYTCILT